MLATAAERRADAAVQLFPNPAGTGAPLTLRVAVPVPAASVGVLDALGRPVSAAVAAAAPTATAFTIQGLTPGLYLLRVALPAGPAVRRFVVQ